MTNFIGHSVKYILPPVLMSKGQYTTPTYANMHQRRLILLGMFFYDTKKLITTIKSIQNITMKNFIGYSIKSDLFRLVVSKGQYTTPTYVNMHRGRKILLGLLFYDTKQPNDNNFVTNIESQKFDRLLALMSKGQYTTPSILSKVHIVGQKI